MTTATPRRFSALRAQHRHAAAPVPRTSRALAPLVVTGLVWAFVCLVLQGQDGDFAVTIERVESPWLALTVLNLPLHLALTLIASWGLLPGARPGLVRASLMAGVAAALLIAGHVVLSIATA